MSEEIRLTRFSLGIYWSLAAPFLALGSLLFFACSGKIVKIVVVSDPRTVFTHIVIDYSLVRRYSSPSKKKGVADRI